ncbi:MAG: sugar ABC transporter permease [Erysipelotrichaceae bacterium]|nr:sugar ABC transporter permease [Erysipelotrichaceae bacterium]
MAESRRIKHRKTVSYAKWAYIFIIPFFISYIIFTLVPQLLTIYNSFFENYMNGLQQIGPNFVGLANYKALLSPGQSGTIDLLKYFGNTMALWILGAVPQFLIALMLAVIFTSARLNIKGQGLAKAIIYMPNLIMASAFSMLIFALFSKVGPINKYLVVSGIIEQSFDFLTVKVSVRSLIALLNFLMWFGNTTIVLMAGIMGIDQSLFESAEIDGSNSIQVFFDITLPLLMPILSYALITSLIGGIQMFDVPQVLTNGRGTPNLTSTTVIMMLNNFLSGSKNYGRAGAVSVLLFIVTGILSTIVYRMLAKQYKD